MNGSDNNTQQPDVAFRPVGTGHHSNIRCWDCGQDKRPYGGRVVRLGKMNIGMRCAACVALRAERKQ